MYSHRQCFHELNVKWDSCKERQNFDVSVDVTNEMASKAWEYKIHSNQKSLIQLFRNYANAEFIFVFNRKTFFSCDSSHVTGDSFQMAQITPDLSINMRIIESKS